MQQIKVEPELEKIVPMSGRTLRGEMQYQIEKRNGNTKPLAEEHAFRTWKHWRLINNRFPYDVIYDRHHMLVPIRQVAERKELKVMEMVELQQILEELADQYDLVFENFARKRSIANHYHIHLAAYHETRESMKL